MEPVPYSTSGPSVKSMSFQFRDKDIMQYSVKCLAQVQVDDVSCLSFVHQHCNPIIEGYQVGQARFAELQMNSQDSGKDGRDGNEKNEKME